MMKLFLFLAGLFLVLTSCQHKATQVYREEPVQVGEWSVKNLLKAEAVILDARPAFEFNLSHAPNSVNVRWEDFSQANPMSRGVLEPDHFALARRLALIGVSPETRVIVLGKGKQGAGEEGRIAWTLKVLGVQEVFTLVHTSFRAQNPRPEQSLVKNKPYWNPPVEDSLQLSLKDFKADAVKTNTFVLDVRSQSEFSHRSLKQNSKFKGKVLHVEWKEFFKDDGLPNKKVIETLAAQGIQPQSRLIVISNHGVRSGAVTYALQYLGFNKVANFAGGYEQYP
ncbi:thiosulfate sulfurtransferase [Bdellovibrio bacteriovorus W]|nr:thiosulfate sulfurtransferase [Bdellovibrio bacteriovorus W]